MPIFFSSQAWIGAGVIFLLRVMDMTLDTLRVLMVMRGRKGIAWGLGFFQAAIFILAITRVLSNLNNPLNVIGYAAGFATGNVVGMWIEERLAIGHIHLSIFSPRRGAALVERLRTDGYAVTELSGRGKDGMVSLLHCNILRKNVERVNRIVKEVDEEAFITAEEIRPVRRGFWGA
jgi:uncharacterized protein YebE (UPF0316 family)